MRGIADLMLQGLSDVEIAQELGLASAAEVRRIKVHYDLLNARKWQCPKCGKERMSEPRPKCRGCSVSMVVAKEEHK
jgi:rubrerythrin